MTLDEAIRHAEEVADYDCYNDEQRRCADEHRQLAEWLKELKRLKESQIEIIRCGECKHRHLDGMIWDCPFGLTGGEDFFCAYGAKDGDEE